MLKVLIVDDEVLVRAGLRTMVNWSDQGFEVIGDAADGEKALQFALEQKPDLVLTDLVMPHHDGLMLIRALWEHLPETKVIVLSCHNDYEYVREAMQMKNVLDYLFKLTMQPQDIEKVLSTAKQEILESRQLKEQETASKMLLHGNQILEYGRFLITQLTQQFASSACEPMRKSSYTLPSYPYAVSAFLIDSEAIASDGTDNLLITTLLKEAVQFNLNVRIGFITHGEYGVVTKLSAENEYALVHSSTAAVVEKLLEQEIVVYAGTSIVDSHEVLFKDSYFQAQRQARAEQQSSATAISQVMEYLKENYQEKIKLADLAEYVHMNESYLSSQIKKSSGMNFTEILNRMRVDEAKKLLLNTDLSVESIADKAGFTSWSYFSRVFKRYCGATPAEYRRRNERKYNSM